MKRILLGTTALVMLSLPAAAADLATKYPVKAVVAAPVFSWTGFYIGANVGFGGDKFSYPFYGVEDGEYIGGGEASLTSSGFFAGGQIGYNYQFSNNVVLGVETDLQWSDINGEAAVSLNGLGGLSLGSKIEYFGTIRARLGYAFDRFLPYITGGFAYGETKSYINFGPFSADTSATNWGWTVGGGAEYAITNNWTFKAEYLYVDLGSSTIYGGSIVGLDYGQLDVDSKFHTIKAGVNYKF